MDSIRMITFTTGPTHWCGRVLLMLPYMLLYSGVCANQQAL